MPRGLAVATLDPASSGAGPTGPYLVNKPFTGQPSSATSPRSPATPSSTPKAGSLPRIPSGYTHLALSPRVHHCPPSRPLCDPATPGGPRTSLRSLGAVDHPRCTLTTLTFGCVVPLVSLGGVPARGLT